VEIWQLHHQQRSAVEDPGVEGQDPHIPGELFSQTLFHREILVSKGATCYFVYI
jgi:hypothetical protein